MRTRAEKLAAAESLRGTPFLCLPGNPPLHKVLGHASDGRAIRAEGVQTVFNDAWLMDNIEGEPGNYIASYRRDAANPKHPMRERCQYQVEVYELAMKLYGGMAPVPPTPEGTIQ